MPEVFWQWLGTQPITKVLMLQNELFQKIVQGQETNNILFSEHTPCFTYTHEPFSSSLRVRQEEFDTMDIPAVRVSRGGGAAFHGPGQITAYTIFELSDPILTCMSLGHMFERAVCAMLFHYGIRAIPTPMDPRYAKNSFARGAWVKGERKIMQYGTRVRRGRKGHAVTQFGFALNVSTDLSYYNIIYPCGLDIPITSMEKELECEIAVKNVLPRLMSALAYEFFPYEFHEL